MPDAWCSPAVQVLWSTKQVHAFVGDYHDVGVSTQHANAIEKGMCTTYMPSDMLASPRRLGVMVTTWALAACEVSVSEADVCLSI